MAPHGWSPRPHPLPASAQHRPKTGRLRLGLRGAGRWGVWIWGFPSACEGRRAGFGKLPHLYRLLSALLSISALAGALSALPALTESESKHLSRKTRSPDAARKSESHSTQEPERQISPLAEGLSPEWGGRRESVGLSGYAPAAKKEPFRSAGNLSSPTPTSTQAIS